MQIEQPLETRYSKHYKETVQDHLSRGSVFFIDVSVYPALNQMWFYAAFIRTTNSNSIATWKVTPKKTTNN